MIKSSKSEQKGGEELKKNQNQRRWLYFYDESFCFDAMGMPKFILEEDFNTAF